MLSRRGVWGRSTTSKDPAAKPTKGPTGFRFVLILLHIIIRVGWSSSSTSVRPHAIIDVTGRFSGASMTLSLLRGNACGRRALFISRSFARRPCPSISRPYPFCMAAAKRKKSSDASPSQQALGEEERSAIAAGVDAMSSPIRPSSSVFATPDLSGGCGGDESLDLSHLSRSKQLHTYWLRRLSMLRRPSARGLVPQLVPDNALGFDAGPTLAVRRGTLFDYVLSQKKAHPDKVILTRVSLPESAARGVWVLVCQS